MANQDQMQPLGCVQNLDGGTVDLSRDYDTFVADLGLAGMLRLDLGQVAVLQVALDDAVRGIRGYQQRNAEGER